MAMSASPAASSIRAGRVSILSTSDTATPARRRWLPWAIGGGVLVLALAAAGIGIALVSSLFRPDPEFASLPDAPDPSLSGTVAYFDDESLCVRVVAAAGQPNREAYCLGDQTPAAAEKEGKDVGVDIAWLPDDRLQLTLYRMVNDPEEVLFAPAWRRIVDVRTGEVEDVPLATFAGETPARDCVTTSPTGERIVTESDDGHAVVTLVTDSGERTLLDVQGNRETYGIDEACWAPHFEWIATSDTRMLVITTGDPALTRTLTPPMTTFYGYDALSWYAVTDADVLDTDPLDTDPVREPPASE